MFSETICRRVPKRLCLGTQFQDFSTNDQNVETMKTGMIRRAYLTGLCASDPIHGALLRKAVQWAQSRYDVG